jgi:GH24 family phage-related lysozyme (muramidase)
MNEGSMKYLDKVVELCRLLNEEKKPDAEWEFEVKKNVDKSLDWVKTKDQAISYIKTLFDKIKNVSDNIKHKILRYVIYSFVGLFTITQMNNIYDGLTKEKPNVEKIETIGSGDKKKEEVKKQPEKKETTQIRNYDDRLVSHIKNEEGSIENKGEPVLVAYDIGDGAKTIGYGHAVFNSESRGNTGGDYSFLPKYNKIIVGKTKITKKQAETILRDDLDKTKIQLNHILDGWGKEGIRPDIDQNMYNAMISMMYNMGVGNFKKTQFIQYVKKNQMDKAKDQIKKESSRSFRRFPGVKDRREKESKMFGGEEINESIGNELKFGKNYASNFLFRRITKEELDETFKHYYEYFYDFWYSLNFRNETFDTFKRRFIDYMMDNIHGELVDGYEGEMGQKLGNGIEEILDEMYGERIEFLWDILTNEEV